ASRVRRPPSGTTLVPYTTLFRSPQGAPNRPDRPGPLAPPGGRRDRRCPQAPRARRAVRADVPRPAYGGRVMTACARCERPSCPRSEEHTSELQSRENLVRRLLLE